MTVPYHLPLECSTKRFVAKYYLSTSRRCGYPGASVFSSFSASLSSPLPTFETLWLSDEHRTRFSASTGNLPGKFLRKVLSKQDLDMLRVFCTPQQDKGPPKTGWVGWTFICFQKIFVFSNCCSPKQIYKPQPIFVHFHNGREQDLNFKG